MIQPPEAGDLRRDVLEDWQWPADQQCAREMLAAEYVGDDVEMLVIRQALLGGVKVHSFPDHVQRALAALTKALSPAPSQGGVELREALKPFAKAADVRLCAGEDYWTDDKTIQGTDIAFHITFGDLRRARAALSDDDGKEGR